MAITAELELHGFEALKTAQINDAAREAMAEVGKAWRSRFAPEHFKNTAFTRYPGKYTPRVGQRGSGRKFNGSYYAHKIKKLGHSNPLEYSGDTKARVARAKLEPKSTGRGSNCKVTIKLPQGLNRRAKGSKVRMGDEMRAVIQAELNALSAVFVKDFEKRLAVKGAKARIRLRAG